MSIKDLEIIYGEEKYRFSSVSISTSKEILIITLIKKSKELDMSKLKSEIKGEA